MKLQRNLFTVCGVSVQSYKMKWKGSFICSNCWSQSEPKTFDNYSKLFGSCFYEESATAKTVFHRLKVSVRKAFEIILWISHFKKGVLTPMFVKLGSVMEVKF